MSKKGLFNMYNIIINGIQEFFYFDIWESFLMVCLLLLMINIHLNILQIVFHTFMLSILNYIVGNLIVMPIIMQVSCIILYSVYCMIVFKISFMTSLINMVKIFFILFIIEMLFAIIYQYIFNIELMAMSNNLLKFYSMIPLRIIEFILIYILYKFKRRDK